MKLSTVLIFAISARPIASEMIKSVFLQPELSTSSNKMSSSYVATNHVSNRDFNEASSSMDKRTKNNDSINNSYDLKISVSINGSTESRESVLQWEARRLQIVVERMNHHLPAALLDELLALTLRPPKSIANITQERQALADAKIRAGNYAMRQLVKPDVFISSLVSLISKFVLSGWAISEIELTSNKGTAEGFAKWFNNKIQQNDELAMLMACPDHYLFGKAFTDGQEVIETTGGAVLPSHFGINYNNSANLPINNDKNYPVQFNGAAINDFGMVIGGTNHLLRNKGTGFEVHPRIFFPSILPSFMIHEHRWHLACEFSNWITAYIEETGDR